MNDRKITRTEFIKKFGLGTATASLGFFLTKISSRAAVNDNLSKVANRNVNITLPVGSVINTTICSTMEEVVKMYGGKKWIQHSGYILRSSDSEVLANRQGKDGGNDNITPEGSFTGDSATISHSATFVGTKATLSHSGGAVGNHKLTIAEMPSHTHTQNPHSHASPFWTNGKQDTGSPDAAHGRFTGGRLESWHYTNQTTATNQNTGGNGSHNHPFTQPNAHTYTPSGEVSVDNHSYTPSGTITMEQQDNLPAYKNVYTWERVE